MTKQIIRQWYYPSTFRNQDINEIIKQLLTFQPMTLIGMPRVGLSRVLRFLLVHPELLEKN